MEKQCFTFSMDLFKDKLLRDREKRKTAPEGIQTHNLLIKRHELHHQCAETAA